EAARPVRRAVLPEAGTPPAAGTPPPSAGCTAATPAASPSASGPPSGDGGISTSIHTAGPGRMHLLFAAQGAHDLLLRSPPPRISTHEFYRGPRDLDWSIIR